MAKAENVQQVVRNIVNNFELDGVTDYSRMYQQVLESTGLHLDNKSVWGLIRKVSKPAQVAFELED
jgi:hypothetical protein